MMGYGALMPTTMLAFATYMFCVAMKIAGAAGYSPPEFLDIVGLGWINSFCFASRHS
jgi:hypothetical protein